MAANMQKFAEDEKANVAKEMAALDSEQEKLDAARRQLQLRLDAVEAYFNTLEGKVPTKKSGSRRTGIKADLMKTLRPHPQGLTRAEILEKMGIKGDKSAEQSVSNALAQGKKKGEIEQDNDGKYKEVRAK